ncbi:MAG TPA: hypothetical protein VFH70_04405 [Acidimicrobiales bacterium]|nr:hypothetical protein [Acidimicrobiales bacterium]
MPRGPRGGTRVGTPGASYGQRTDLNQQRSLPVAAAPHQTYGAVQAQMEAQRQVPMAAPPSTPAPQAAPGGPTPAPSPIPPGAHGPIDRPTERPTEPVTAGAALGPGPGPAAIPQGPSNPQNTNLSTMLAQIAQATGSQAIANLAQHAMGAGQ